MAAFSLAKTWVSSGCKHHVMRLGIITTAMRNLMHSLKVLSPVCIPLSSMTRISGLPGATLAKRRVRSRK
jgi:hypothetical protein